MKNVTWLYRIWKIFITNWIQFLIFLIVAGLLIMLYYGYDSKNEATLSFKLWNSIDPIAGIGTLFITLFVLYNQAKHNFYKSLENRLSVEYIYNEEVIIKIENAYLSGESDIRQWAQSLGFTIIDSHLKFDLNWDDSSGMKLKTLGGKVYKTFYIKINLAKNPFETSKVQNSNSGQGSDKKKSSPGEKFLLHYKGNCFLNSKVEGDIDDLPIIWSAKFQ